MAFPAAKAIANISPAALAAHLGPGGPSTPLLLRGLVGHWPAMREWANSSSPTPSSSSSASPASRTLDFGGLAGLRAQVGEDTAVDVEVGPRGRGYLDPEWQRITMGFGLFLDAFVLNRIPSSDPRSLPVGYLAQADLLDPNTHPALCASVPELAHYKALNGDIYRRTLWIGPAGSFTPFHRDPNAGLYTQVLGSKVFHLAPPDARDKLRPSTSALHGNTSTAPTYTRELLRDGGEWTSVLDAVGRMEGACEARLEEGDSVLIPARWWHSAEGVGGAGVGVNAWFR